MPSTFLNLAVPLLIATIYIDSRPVIDALRDGAATLNPRARLTGNLLFAAVSLVLTSSLVLTGVGKPNLQAHIRGTVAFLAVFNVTIHWAVCHFLRHAMRSGKPLPSTVGMYRDARWINYFDQAVYWAVVLELLPYVWKATA